jgi:sporulation protein YlmC with PRC-barrel domain
MSRLVFSGLLLLVPVLAHAEDMAPSALNSLSSVPPGIASAQVMDQNGHALGKVEQVQTDQDGKPTAISIRSTNTGRIVVVAAAEASFDGRVVITSSDQPQIAELIGAPTRTAAK